MNQPIVRAKFVVYGVAELNLGGKKQSEFVQLRAVYKTCPENKVWAEATPSGELSLSISNPGAFDVFYEGQEFFIDFTPVDKGRAAFVPLLSLHDAIAEVSTWGTIA